MSGWRRAVRGSGAAWLNTVAKAGGVALSFALNVVLARTMTPEAFADVAVIFAWLTIATALVAFSMPLMLVRYTAEYLGKHCYGHARGVIRFAIATPTGWSIALALCVAAVVAGRLFALPRDMAQSVLVGCALLVAGVLLQLLGGLLQGLKHVIAAEALSNVLRPALMLAGLCALWLLHRSPIPAPVALVAYLVATLGGVAASVAYAWKLVPAAVARAQPAYEYRAWLQTALGFMAVTITAAFNERVGLLVIGWSAPPSEVAVYAVAVRFAQTLIVAVSAVTAVMTPQLLERLHEFAGGQRSAVRALVHATARTVLYLCLLAVAGFGLLAPALLALFGKHYASAYGPLMVMTAGQAVAALFGPAALVATLIGQTRVAITSLAAGIAVNAALNLALVPQLGADGAAVATAAGAITTALTGWSLMRRRDLDTSVLGARVPGRRA